MEGVEYDLLFHQFDFPVALVFLVVPLSIISELQWDEELPLQ